MMESIAAAFPENLLKKVFPFIWAQLKVKEKLTQMSGEDHLEELVNEIMADYERKMAILKVRKQVNPEFLF